MLRKQLYQQYKNQSGIYKLIINNKSYIGSAKNIGIRLSKHLLDLERDNHHSIYLQRAWNKYQTISIEIIEFCNNLIEKEQYYLDELKPEYNLCSIAQNCSGINRTDEHKNKISQHHKDNKEYWEEIYKNRNLKHTQETKNKISEKSKGKIFSKETRIKLSKAKSLSEDVIKQIIKLRLEKVSLSNVAKMLGISRESVKKYQKYELSNNI
jgi:group I intron endonuclease